MPEVQPVFVLLGRLDLARLGVEVELKLPFGSWSIRVLDSSDHVVRLTWARASETGACL